MTNLKAVPRRIYVLDINEFAIQHLAIGPLMVILERGYQGVELLNYQYVNLKPTKDNILNTQLQRNTSEPQSHRIAALLLLMYRKGTL